MFKRMISIILIALVVFALSFFAASYFFPSPTPYSLEETSVPNSSSSTVSVLTTSTIKTLPEEITHEVTSTTEINEFSSEVLLKVPFTPQAPFGDWSDPRQQDGCEEASVVMAWKWATGQDLTRQEALQEITKMSDWEKENYGTSRDTSAADTLGRLLREYYGYSRGRVEYDITLDDVRYELAKGNILIIPFDGQLLENSNFKPPGPERHMLVVIGYDDIKKQIITNDPGTRLGEGFAYSYDNFELSFRDYETGDHEPISGRRSAMIVIEKVVSF